MGWRRFAGYTINEIVICALNDVNLMIGIIFFYYALQFCNRCIGRDNDVPGPKNPQHFRRGSKQYWFWIKTFWTNILRQQAVGFCNWKSIATSVAG